MQDRSFLHFEDATTHMHLGGLLIFEAGPLSTPEGGIDIARIRAHIAGRLHRVPRYRQRLGWIPVFNQAVWVDDDHFHLGYHVRHAALPRPGDDAHLKALTARIMSQQLDRGKPLWELWIVEGLAHGRFALLMKTHHAIADGISAFDLFTALVSPTPDETVAEPEPWTPRPAPTGARLLADGLAHQAATPITMAQRLFAIAGDPAGVGASTRAGMRALLDLAGAVTPPPPTPLNRPISAHRRFEWLTLDLDEVRAVKAKLGGTVNDVALASVSGGLHHFLKGRGVDVRTLVMRIVVPVSVRTEDERGQASNRASGWLIDLPIHETDPRRRQAHVSAETRKRKETRQELGPEVLGRAAEYVVPGVVGLGVRLLSRLHPYNLIVTNVPGPQFPLYLLGARLLTGFPQVPLFENQGLGIALFSYCGSLGFGFNADRDVVPDLDDFAAAVAKGFDELARAAHVR
ncbi:MAG: wax ester/triacylglycerol synthase family O-acyltransferase [Deltaproteobacteria bacterium]|nr:wax ester/triacylglycerol synthase family O-acyltransferase [Deltaproteobacteria bacterium]